MTRELDQFLVGSRSGEERVKASVLVEAVEMGGLFLSERGAVDCGGHRSEYLSQRNKDIGGAVEEDDWG